MSNNQINNKDPFINAHTHIFNAGDTPNLLARRFIISPFYYLIRTNLIIKISRFVKKLKAKKYSYTSKNKAWQKYLSSKAPFNIIVNRILLIIANIIFFFYGLYVFQSLFDFWPVKGCLDKLYNLESVKPFLFLEEDKRFGYISILLVLFILFKKLRNWFFGKLWATIKKRLGKEWVDFMLRYTNLINYAGYSKMSGIFTKLKIQYPVNTKFVVLPMDMEFMKAGSVKRPYRAQMDALLNIKKNNKEIIYPFLFAHPERMKEVEKGVPYFDGAINKKGEFELKKCDVKTYFEKGCAGVKIYPATGYYVFDESLLPLWLYCAQNDIPITSHCSVGPIFYRGNLKKLSKNIDSHPIFMEKIGENKDDSDKLVNLRLPLHKNSVFQKNFTHPLNYLCLLDEYFLKKVLDHYDSDSLNELFGYDTKEKEKPLARNLSKLKINLAHYGGAENWEQFLNQDRYDYANYIINRPERGLDLVNKTHKATVLTPIWHYVDWFSIISSMMLNFENVYTDISYTSHDLNYLNLLSEILDNPKISERVLYGTDFYVVSNHKTEKQYWIDMQNSLGEEKWSLIAKENPTRFLTSKLPGSI